MNSSPPICFEVREDGGKIQPVKELEIIRASRPHGAPSYRQGKRARSML